KESWESKPQIYNNPIYNFPERKIIQHNIWGTKVSKLLPTFMYSFFFFFKSSLFIKVDKLVKLTWMIIDTMKSFDQLSKFSTVLNGFILSFLYGFSRLGSLQYIRLSMQQSK
ncbi:hypothetical protein GIB67_039306, partial [Kingdonia uniflora]